MSVTKTILVLANSIKKGGRCVAGRELVSDGEGRAAIGPWVRPIDPDGDEGTISNGCIIVGDRPIVPLDVIEIDFEGNADDPHHPEDWKIVRTSRWRRAGRYGLETLDSLPDETGDLWGRHTAANRRVLPVGGIPTLKLVKPTGEVGVEAYMDQTPWGPKFRCMLSLELEGINHLFTIDDPVFSNRHNLNPRAVGVRRVGIRLDPARTAVVASLTPPFNGYHYKIAATIFER